MTSGLYMVFFYKIYECCVIICFSIRDGGTPNERSHSSVCCLFFGVYVPIILYHTIFHYSRCIIFYYFIPSYFPITHTIPPTDFKFWPINFSHFFIINRFLYYTTPPILTSIDHILVKSTSLNNCASGITSLHGRVIYFDVPPFVPTPVPNVPPLYVETLYSILILSSNNTKPPKYLIQKKKK